MAKNTTLSLDELKASILENWGEYSFSSMTEEKAQQRREAWSDPNCKKLYYQLINFAGGRSMVSTKKKEEAKHLAISSFILGSIPDYQRFKDGLK